MSNNCCNHLVAARRGLSPMIAALMLAAGSSAGCGVESPDAGWEAWSVGVHALPQVTTDGHLADHGLSCRMENTIDAGDVRVRMVVSNDNESPVELLKFDTLWDRYSPLFTLSSPAARARYMGWRASGRTPDKNSFVSIEGYGTITAEYDLNAHYAVESPADFHIRLRSPVVSVRVDGKLLRLKHDCGEGSVRLEATSAPSPEVASIEQALVPYGCNAGQSARVANAATVARSATFAARNIVSDNSVYREWFGAWRDWNGDEVYAHLDQILGSAWNKKIRCGGGCCNDGNPNACVRDYLVTERIHVCHNWHSLPTLSVEAWSSQAGVLVHELTHAADPKLVPGTFNRFSHPFETNDHAYGAGGARNLAAKCTSDRCKAVRNAENYEHFVSAALVNAIVVSL